MTRYRHRDRWGGRISSNAPGKDNNIIYVDVSADTKYVLFASNKKIELKRVDDTPQFGASNLRNKDYRCRISHESYGKGQIFSMCVSKHILIYNFTCCECNLVKERRLRLLRRKRTV